MKYGVFQRSIQDHVMSKITRIQAILKGEKHEFLCFSVIEVIVFSVREMFFYLSPIVVFDAFLQATHVHKIIESEQYDSIVCMNELFPLVLLDI